MKVRSAYIRIVNSDAHDAAQQPYIKISFKKCQNFIDELKGGERHRSADGRQMGHQNTQIIMHMIIGCVN